MPDSADSTNLPHRQRGVSCRASRLRSAGLEHPRADRSASSAEPELIDGALCGEREVKSYVLAGESAS
jgi:hypothetical protein